MRTEIHGVRCAAQVYQTWSTAKLASALIAPTTTNAPPPPNAAESTEHFASWLELFHLVDYARWTFGQRTNKKCVHRHWTVSAGSYPCRIRIIDARVPSGWSLTGSKFARLSAAKFHSTVRSQFRSHHPRRGEGDLQEGKSLSHYSAEVVVLTAPIAAIAAPHSCWRENVRSGAITMPSIFMNITNENRAQIINKKS